jgi:hypothetical protein
LCIRASAVVYKTQILVHTPVIISSSTTNSRRRDGFWEIRERLL